jgi:hypothetical protein
LLGGTRLCALRPLAAALLLHLLNGSHCGPDEAAEDTVERAARRRFKLLGGQLVAHAGNFVLRSHYIFSHHISPLIEPAWIIQIAGVLPHWLIASCRAVIPLTIGTQIRHLVMRITSVGTFPLHGGRFQSSIAWIRDAEEWELGINPGGCVAISYSEEIGAFARFCRMAYFRLTI